MSFERASAIADAVLMEGYLLYPYRASSTKNRFRWAFGVLAPRAWSEGDAGCEPWWMETQCLIMAGPALRLEGRLRFLQLQSRRLEVAAREGGFRAVDALEVDGDRLMPWDEGELREIDFIRSLAVADPSASAESSGKTPPSLRTGGVRTQKEAFARCASESLGAHTDSEWTLPFRVSGGESIEEVSGEARGRIVRTKERIEGRIRIRIEPRPIDAGGADGVFEAPAEGRRLLKLTARVENLSPWSDSAAPRDLVLRSACLSTHLLLRVSDGAFVSQLDPPAWAAEAARGCTSVRGFPILADDPGRDDLVLASPIILYDHPKIAPESPGDLYDGTEIDEILTLRTLLLTDDEKAEVRATDSRAAAIVERTDSLPPEAFAKLHGALRDLRRAEMVPRSESIAQAAVGPWQPEPVEGRCAPRPAGPEAWISDAAGAADLHDAQPLAAAPLEAGADDMPPRFGTTSDNPEGLDLASRIPAQFRPGNRVRLRPGVRRTDAQDLLFAGRVATVEKVMLDVDGRELLGLTIDDDPAAALHRWYGRFHYYGLDEVEPLGDGSRP